MASNNEDVHVAGVQAASRSVNLDQVESCEKDTKEDGAINQMDIQTETAFVGLGKQELMELANRPFWVRLRWALFFTFWGLWLALLVGAALIIALSPGCENIIKDKSIETVKAHHP